MSTGKNKDNITKDSAGASSYNVDRTEKRIDDLDKRVNEIQIQFIQVIGIFVALFTFISVEFQIFRSFTDWQAAASLSSILLAGLFSFLQIFNWFIFKKTHIILWGVVVVLFAFGIYFFSQATLIADDVYRKKDIEYNYTLKTESNLLEERLKSLEEFRRCLENGGWKICF